MRKLAWVFVILFLALLIVSVTSVFVPPVKDAFKGGLELVFGSIWNGINAGWDLLRGVVSATGLYFLVYTLAVFGIALVSGGWIVRQWHTHAPKVLGGRPSTTTMPFTPQVAPAVPESAPRQAVTPTVPQSEPKKEEGVAA